MAPRTCVACGRKIGAFDKWQTCQGGCLCQDCHDAAVRYRSDVGYMGAREVADAIAKVKLNDQTVAEFDDTFHLGNKFGYVAMFDDRTERVLLPKRISSVFQEQEFWAFPYADIISAELKRGEQVVRVSGLGRAVVGGLLLGVVGAAAGYASAQDKRANPGSDDIDVEVKVRNYPTASYKVHILDGGLKETSPKIESALSDAIELVERLNRIAGYAEPSDEQPAAVVQQTSDADELRKFKALMDDGIISPEEFEAKKAQLLGL